MGDFDSELNVASSHFVLVRLIGKRPSVNLKDTISVCHDLHFTHQEDFSGQHGMDSQMMNSL